MSMIKADEDRNWAAELEKAEAAKAEPTKKAAPKRAAAKKKPAAKKQPAAKGSRWSAKR